MDEQLPQLDNFKVIEALPKPPEPWWNRYYTYICFSIINTLLLGVGTFLYIAYEQSSLADRGQFYRLHFTTAERNERIYIYASAAAILGMVASIIGCYSMEKNRKK